MKDSLATPTRRSSTKGTRTIGVILIVAVLLTVAAGAVGAMVVVRTAAEAETARKAEALAETLPDTVNLAVNLSFERDAMLAGVPPVVLRPMVQTTDESAQAWLARVQGIESGGEHLDATVSRIEDGLAGIDDLRTQARTDPASVAERYTALSNDLFSIADDVPSTGEGETASSIEAIRHMPEIWESLGQERTTMNAVLARSPLPGDKQAGDKEIAALTEAEANLRRSLAGFYEKSSTAQRRALDELTNGTAVEGATGVPAQQAVNEIIAGDGSDLTPDSYAASSTDLMRGLQAVVTASAEEIVEDRRAVRDDALRGAMVAFVLTVVVLGVLAVLVLVLAVLLVVLRSSAAARGARG
ncbi:nitrate- and nitrite sensing domain-containing protein [Nocardioides sp. NPDC057772]|uniref:nitrate- and nitrite sensing domain-containing protein n=1 Tax=Nocardioides sp. NPDC057772 TaxID=3346245 RepID=UPI003670DB6A